MANMSYAAALKKDVPAVKAQGQNMQTASEVEAAGQCEIATKIETPRRNGTARQVEIAKKPGQSHKWKSRHQNQRQQKQMRYSHASRQLKKSI